MRRLLLALACALLLLAPAASAGARKPLLGILGDMERFEQLTGQKSRVGHVIIAWNQGYLWGARFERLFLERGEIPMIGIGTGSGPTRKEAITPQGIAFGQGDDYLIALNAAIAAWGKTIYIRPLGEMNGYWNFYCAYTKTGRPKGPTHSTATFRKAFARIYIILHGGTAAEINARLRKLGPPGISTDLPVNPYPTLRVVWNPQGYGAPDIPGNSAQAYYPGDAFVDVVGNDLYDIRGDAEWEANEALYKAHPKKPYAIPEWGLWNIDDPLFILRMAEFVKTHKRVELLSYYESAPGSIFDLETKPKSRKAYRELITPLG